jgi:ribosomal protein S18 acetylase RimI-like enzyme
MGITIDKGNIVHLKDCEEAIVNSELGKRYFSQTGSARSSLEKGFANDDIYVALDDNSICTGFVWVIANGAFHSFPYIHIIAVKSENRGQGIGKVLLQYVEDVYYQNNSKLFLVVADFNPEAKRLYESLGYTAIGDIPDLYRKGITECLMMKSKESI